MYSWRSQTRTYSPVQSTVLNSIVISYFRIGGLGFQVTQCFLHCRNLYAYVDVALWLSCFGRCIVLVARLSHIITVPQQNVRAMPVAESSYLAQAVSSYRKPLDNIGWLIHSQWISQTREREIHLRAVRGRLPSDTKWSFVFHRALFFSFFFKLRKKKHSPTQGCFIYQNRGVSKDGLDGYVYL